MKILFKLTVTLKPLKTDLYLAGSTWIRHLTKSKGTTIVWVDPHEIIPPRPQRRKYLLDPNAHESATNWKLIKKLALIKMKFTSWKDNIWNSCGCCNLASFNQWCLILVILSAFTIDGCCEGIVCKFLEQHFYWIIVYNVKEIEN